jgi:hypothetical protein
MHHLTQADKFRVCSAIRGDTSQKDYANESAFGMPAGTEQRADGCLDKVCRSRHNVPNWIAKFALLHTEMPLYRKWTTNMRSAWMRGEEKKKRGMRNKNTAATIEGVRHDLAFDCNFY